jgi:WD40 repeat protein
LDHPLIILADQALRNRGDGDLLTKDETRILSWSEDKTLRLWDVATSQEIGPAMKHDDSVYGALLRRPRRFRCPDAAQLTFCIASSASCPQQLAVR